MEKREERRGKEKEDVARKEYDLRVAYLSNIRYLGFIRR